MKPSRGLLVYYVSMIGERFQLVITWTLLTIQATAMAASPVGLVICRDVAGSSHLEWTRDACCIGDETIAETQKVSETDRSNPCDTWSCAGAECDDQPVEIGPDLPMFRLAADEWVPTPPVPSIEFQVSVAETASSKIDVSAFPDVRDGPPKQEDLALRATILIL